MQEEYINNKQTYEEIVDIYYAKYGFRATDCTILDHALEEAIGSSTLDTIRHIINIMNNRNNDAVKIKDKHIFLSAANCRVDVVKCLLRSANLCDTRLWSAIRSDQKLETIKILVENGVLLMPDDFSCAAELERTDLIIFFLEYYKSHDVDVVDEIVHLALESVYRKDFVVSEHSFYETIEILLGAGARLCDKDADKFCSRNSTIRGIYLSFLKSGKGAKKAKGVRNEKVD